MVSVQGASGEGWEDIGESFPPVSPLSPVIVVFTTDELPLVQTALESATALGGNTYLVPAIFLKYRADRMLKDAAEKGAMITLDAVTIYSSGGIALAAKVSWARRAWAIAEVAGALGNIGVNTGAIKPEDKLYKAVEAYNVAMVFVGIKNAVTGAPTVAKGIYSFAKNITTDARELLEQNKNIRELLVANYVNWKVAITDLSELSAAEKQLVNEGRIAEVRSIPAEKLKQLEEEEKVWKMLGVADKVVSAENNLANYANIRGYLGNSGVTQYLNNNNALLDAFQKVIRKAHPDVLKYMNEMDMYDFAEMVRGYNDLIKVDKLSTFENAIASLENFNGQRGWLNYWRLTPEIKYSLTTIEDLKKANKLLPTGNATEIQLASLQAFTRKGDFINNPMRYNKSYLGAYADKGYTNIVECLEELRKIDERKIINEDLFSGKAYSKADFEKKFVGGAGKPTNFPSFISTSLRQSVAEEFVILTEKWAGDGDKIAVIQRIKSKEGVLIDDLSDWGEHLGSVRHADEPKGIQRQYEVLLNPGDIIQIGEPIPIKKNGVQVQINGMDAYYVDFSK